MAQLTRLLRRSFNLQPYKHLVMCTQRIMRESPTFGGLNNYSRSHSGVHSLLPPQIQKDIHNAWSQSPCDFLSVVPRRFLTSKCSDGSGKPPPGDKKPAKGDEKCKGKEGTQSSDGRKHNVPLAPTGRQVVQNFHDDCIKRINSQINHELRSAYYYMAMASFCRQDNVALMGFSKFFTDSYKEEIEHAQTFIDYLNSRGGQLHLEAIPEQMKHAWTSVEDLLSDALNLEMLLNKDLLALHECASQHADPHLTNFLEDVYLTEQVEAIKKLADLLTIVRRVGGCCLYIVDRDLLSGVFSPHGGSGMGGKAA